MRKWQGYGVVLDYEQDGQTKTTLISFGDNKLRADGSIEIGTVVTTPEVRGAHKGLTFCVMNFLMLSHFCSSYWACSWHINGAMVQTFNKHSFRPYYFSKDGKSSCFIDERINDDQQTKAYSIYVQRESLMQTLSRNLSIENQN